MRYPIVFLSALILLLSACSKADKYTIEIADGGWYLWCDTAAQWQNDNLYLPGEFSLDTLPVNPPTGGWDILSSSVGKEITLPSTVEEHYWGRFGLKNYTEKEYYYAQTDSSLKNGSYLGVSWWYKELRIPSAFNHKQIELKIRGARQRAEVYLNGQLVGYNLIGEISFTCDLTKAAKPGEKNLLAIRITNPGGRLDWIDNHIIEWGKYNFQRTHSFGGLDRGLIMRAHDNLYINDFWVLNTANPTKVLAKLLLVNNSDKKHKVNLVLSFSDLNGNEIKTMRKHVYIEANQQATIVDTVLFEGAHLWNINTPELYLLKAAINTEGPIDMRDSKKVKFGFRWFAPEGIGTNAVLKFNGERIRLLSAISWGFWGYNGLFPTLELAEKEVMQAKNIGLNCLQFHRNPGKTDVLDVQDRLGLYRYMEPGGGMTGIADIYAWIKNIPSDTGGVNGKAQIFAHRYMEAKILGMMRDHRSHPSLLMYCIQNEFGGRNLRNPRVEDLIHKMQDVDPSRVIILTSGIEVENQAWVEPYKDTIYKDNGTGFSGWFDNHTVGGEGVWKDKMYKSAEEFTHRSVNDSEIVCWGEMLGAAVPDNHQIMMEQLKIKGKSYDLDDHQLILDGYNDFLETWKFKPAFPSANELFIEIGNKSYDFWGRVIETAKLSESNDYLVISGWESTTIENHSGLVDNLRNFKGNPELLSKRFEPLHAVFKPTRLVVQPGDTLVYDVYLINETNKPHQKRMKLIVNTPDGRNVDAGEFVVPDFIPGRFVYPVAMRIKSSVFNVEGKYKYRLLLDGYEKSTDETILAISSVGDTLTLKSEIGVITDNSAIIDGLNKLGGINAERYNPKKKYSLLIASSAVEYGSSISIDKPSQDILKTTDDELYRTAATEAYPYPYNKLSYVFNNIKNGNARITLYMADIGGARPFNLSINGEKKLNQFNIKKEAGGRYTAIQRTYNINITDGTIRITPGNNSTLCAFKIELKDSVFAINCGGSEYIDSKGFFWHSYKAPILLNTEIISKVKEGTPLLVLPYGPDGAFEYAKTLAQNGAFEYLGHVGGVKASWMGTWHFVKEHPVLEGLPSNCVLGSYYQANVEAGDGILLQGNNVEVFGGYSRDHDPNVGASAFTTMIGHGKILFIAFPGIAPTLAGDSTLINPLMAKRIVCNSIRYLNIIR